MGYRQSDDRIVPLIACNSEGGKPRENCSSRFLSYKAISRGKHYLYAEIGVNNGNKTCENITNVYR